MNGPCNNISGLSTRIFDIAAPSVRTRVLRWAHSISTRRTSIWDSSTNVRSASMKPTRRRSCVSTFSRRGLPVNLPNSYAALYVVVVYHVTIVAIRHGLLKEFWPLVLGCVLSTAGSSIIWNYADPLTSLELLNYYLTLAMSSSRFCIVCHSTPSTTVFL